MSVARSPEHKRQRLSDATFPTAACLHPTGMHSGIGLLDMLNFKEHFAAIERGEQSKLQFKGPSSKQEVG